MCISEGATDLVAPKASTPFKVLIKNLEELGVIRRHKKTPSKPEHPDHVPSLQGAHRDEVYSLYPLRASGLK